MPGPDNDNPVIIINASLSFPGRFKIKKNYSIIRRYPLMRKKLSFFIVFLLVIALLFVSFPALAAGGQAAKLHTIEKKTYPHLYCFKEGTENSGELNLYFMDGGDVPYIALTEFIPVMAEMYNTVLKCDDDNRVAFEIQSIPQDSSTVFIVTRPDNNSTWIIQPEEDTFTFTNFNSFGHRPGTSTLVSVTDLPDLKQSVDLSELAVEIMYAMKNGEDSTELQMKGLNYSAAEDPAAQHSLFVASNKIFNRRGKTITMDLGDYQIDIISEDGECYIPLQTMSDVFFSMQYTFYVFNGEKVIGDIYRGTLIDQAYEAEPADMSPEFAMFNFHELCFFLDFFYGLKPEHHIENFADFIAMDAAMLPQLSGTDSVAFDAALSELLIRYFDDSHSALARNSWRSGLPIGSEFIGQFLNLGYSYSILTRSSSSNKLADLRRAAYPDGVPGYEEIGDTAFVTFDSFTVNRSPEEYYELEDPDNPQDTIELIIYANKMVRREGSPVKNIVLDLSLNGGGDSDAAIVVTSWFTGEARFALLDTMTDAQTITAYRTDLNLNGAALRDPDNPAGNFDPGDTVNGQYNLYCLISSASFSCGNLVPAIFNQAGEITLIGQRSGGGSNVVLPATTASGMVFQMSGPLQITTFTNGSLYGVDTGVEPHVRLNNFNSYYDREGLVELIHNLK